MSIFSIETHSGSTNAHTSATPYTLPSSYSTVLNDVIVVGWSQSGSAPTFSGAGATWVLHSVAGAGTGPFVGIAVGYGCSAGQTQFSIASGNNFSDMCVAVCSGGDGTNPFSAVASNAVSGGGGAVTTGSLSYTSGSQVLFGVGGYPATGGTSNLATWSNGATDHNTGQSNLSRPCQLDYCIPASGSSTTLTMTSSLTTNAASALAVALTFQLTNPVPPPPHQPSFVAQMRASTWFSRVPWKERVGGFLVPSDAERRLVIAG